LPRLHLGNKMTNKQDMLRLADKVLALEHDDSAYADTTLLEQSAPELARAVKEMEKFVKWFTHSKCIVNSKEQNCYLDNCYSCRANSLLTWLRGKK